MSLFSDLRASFPSASPGADEPFAVAVRKAQLQLSRASALGTAVPDNIMGPIIRAAEQPQAGNPPDDVVRGFYPAYAELTRLLADIARRLRRHAEHPFDDAVADAEQLLKYAAETGALVPSEIAAGILEARTASKANQLTDTAREHFYASYAKLSKLFGEVTADTIRHCSSARTRRHLMRSKTMAVSLTVFVAVVSVLTFVGDTMSKRILDHVAQGNVLAAGLSAGLTGLGSSTVVDEGDARGDPCALLDVPPVGQSRPRTIETIQQLQLFASLVRELRGDGMKLNALLSRPLPAYLECDPLSSNEARGCPPPKPVTKDEKAAQMRKDALLGARLELNPALINVTAEALCKIRTYQSVRDFAGNVQANYASYIGAFTSHALPILYAWLGAYAFRLRLFVETIRKRTYHPSFADSARMITAVIAGAICGLFNPAQGLSLSPLATAFLIGYGVELFFRFLDALTNAFGSAAPTVQRAAK